MEEDLDLHEDSREEEEEEEEDNEDPFVDNLIYQIEDLRNKVKESRRMIGVKKEYLHFFYLISI